MSQLRNFTIPTARPLPVIILADASGSMEQDDKIIALNRAIAEMIRSFAAEDSADAEIQVAVISFGGNSAEIHQKLLPAYDIEWADLEPFGRTPMGMAFEQAQMMLEDREIIPSRAYTPTLVLVSDGIPTDDWQTAFKKLLASERASKAARFAMAVGDDANVDMLKEFSTIKVFQAHESRQIRQFFEFVTLSVASRSRSDNPNRLEATEIDDISF